MANQLVILAAGGTGGHLFPAYALAEELARRGTAVELATDMRGDRYGTGFPARAVHRIHAATISGRSPLAAAGTGLTLVRGIRQAYQLLGEVKPEVVVGFGGYPSFPPLVAARMRGIATILHEQNAVLGRANRMLARRVDRIATSFKDIGVTDRRLLDKIRYTGNPVRDLVLRAAERPYIDPGMNGTLSLVVFGGSQGARYFADVVPPAVALLPERTRVRLKITQQAREEDVERTRAVYAQAGLDADVQPFFRDLPERLAGAHLVIARAGASTIAELEVIGRPAILVPLPHALDNDQLRNATKLAESGGAWCIEQKDLGEERLAAEIERLANAPDELARAAAAARAGGMPDAVQRLADLVDELAFW